MIVFLKRQRSVYLAHPLASCWFVSLILYRKLFAILHKNERSGHTAAPPKVIQLPT
jgi:hypothetical protein